MWPKEDVNTHRPTKSWCSGIQSIGLNYCAKLEYTPSRYKHHTFPTPSLSPFQCFRISSKIVLLHWRGGFRLRDKFVQHGEEDTAGQSTTYLERQDRHKEYVLLHWTRQLFWSVNGSLIRSMNQKILESRCGTIISMLLIQSVTLDVTVCPQKEVNHKMFLTVICFV